MQGLKKGISSLVKSAPAASGAVSDADKAARSLLRSGAKYVDIGKPPQNFNPSGFLKGPKKA